MRLGYINILAISVALIEERLNVKLQLIQHLLHGGNVGLLLVLERRSTAISQLNHADRLEFY